MKRPAKICQTCESMGQWSYFDKKLDMMIIENTHKGWTGCKKGLKPSNCDYEDLIEA